ncbi:LacI family DNA-binding transcriptional regulator [Jannaschia sp. CCS1]|uniref:LacI family DNA-binding transcriptional regulator n=1 Tax=Jannaschia sp. (strain CCS1) TaxID=290400 RepID=UPI00006BFFDA|nr:LacI family DNA-binding transcriptional regulator [Jannaschia sp. CCS1]ABD54199.1 transcriptional regulator, LacI family [Jannaschia sp. CCS1]
MAALAQLTERTARDRVTISHMADALGVTKSTVSRAMNGYPDISEATQLRVKRMAEKMGYQPLSHAQAIKTGRARSLGLVLQFSDHDAQRPFLAEFLAGLSAGAHTDGWTLTVAAADGHDELIETFRAILRDGKADGFILPRAMSTDPRVYLLRDAGVPFVLFGRQDKEEGCAWFDVLGEEAMCDAVLHLATLGHRRIGFINGGLQYAYARLRAAGFADGMQIAGLEMDDSLIADDAMTMESGAVAAARILDTTNPPTALVCAVDFAALGAYRAAADRGIIIGRDLSIIGYDGIPEGAFAHPPLTTFAVDNRAAGFALATLLIQRIKGEPLETLRRLVPATFVERASTGPAKA